MDTMIFPLEWLNCGSQSIAKPLSALIDNGIFPDIWKKSSIIPVHDRQIINNYRLVSLLPICDKIFEKLLYNSIFNFLLKLKQPPEASYKKDVLKNFENSQENACNFIEKEPLSQALFWELNEIFKNTFFTEHLQAIILVPLMTIILSILISQDSGHSESQKQWLKKRWFSECPPDILSKVFKRSVDDIFVMFLCQWH